MARNMKTNTEISTAKSQRPEKLLFDLNETAERLSMSVVSCRKLVRQNRLRRVPDFRKVLIPASELERFAATALAR